MTFNSHHLPGSVHIASNKDQLFDDLAKHLTAIGVDAYKQRDVFHIALSGGSTPEPFYRLLVMDPDCRAIPWKNTHIWIVDERRVPEDDEKSNIKMIRQSLTDHLPTSQKQIHSMNATCKNADADYEAQLRQAFGLESTDTAIPQLDFVLLGMGDDAHTASLFPQSPAIAEQNKLVTINQGQNVTPPDRVTMTYPLLNQARHIAILLAGSKKQVSLNKVATQCQAGKPDIANLPITGINPVNGKLTWYMDEAASGKTV